MSKHVIVILSVLGLGLAACSGANEHDITSGSDLGAGSGGSSGNGGSSAACTKAECGPEPLLASQVCKDGSTAGPVCERNAKNACGWVITSCPVPPPPPPTPVCDKTTCGPEPLIASRVCWDGSTAGPVCELNAKTNTCGWDITVCPPEPVCDANACGPNPYGMPNHTCADGTVAGPVCKANSKGTCGWTIVSCN
jgi:hypothetical protein